MMFLTKSLYAVLFFLPGANTDVRYDRTFFTGLSEVNTA